MTTIGSRGVRRTFYAAGEFPELVELQREWPTIRDEARQALDELGPVLGHPASQSWILPLVPEAEDAHLIPAEVYARARALAPIATARCSAIAYVVAFAFSRLVAGTHIAQHAHWNPYLTGILTLDDGGANSHIVVAGQRHDFVDGDLMLFDYTLPHESKNEGEGDRIVMLMIIDRRLQRR